MPAVTPAHLVITLLAAHCESSAIICFADAHPAILQMAGGLSSGAAVMVALFVALYGWRREDRRRHRANDEFMILIADAFAAALLSLDVAWGNYQGGDHEMVSGSCKVRRVERIFAKLDKIMETPREQWPSTTLLIACHDFRDTLVDLRGELIEVEIMDKFNMTIHADDLWVAERAFKAAMGRHYNNEVFGYSDILWRYDYKDWPD
jgi:hypothetical protein